MKQYKRLTNNNRNEYDPEYDFCCNCKYFGEPNGCNRPNGTCGNYDRFLETYNRLAELEDKIENGTLVELPCKEGDIVYFVNWYRPTPRIEAFKVDHLEVNKNYIRVACYDFENEDNYSMYRIDSKDISLTKDEALKKLKELKRNT